MAKCTCSVIGCILLLVLAQNAAAVRGPIPAPPAHVRSSDTCSTCKLAMHVLSDVLCDPYIDSTAATWLVENLCPHFSDKQQCAEMVVGLTPALVEWLRANMSPEIMCKDAGVCGSRVASMRSAPKLRARANDMTCPVCVMVVSKLKDVLGDPSTQANIHDKSLEVCAQLPEGGVRSACVTFVEQYEGTLFKYLNLMDAQDICMLMGTCISQAVSAAPTASPLTPAALEPLSGLVEMLHAPPSNDNCETCKIIVMEVHQVLANPNLQAQLVDYAKQACGAIASLQDQCVRDVDQYAPMVFGMVLAYLQPDQVCTQLQMCPPPSAQLLLASDAVLAAGKFRYALVKAQAAHAQVMVS